MLDFNLTGNKLTALQKHVMQSAVRQIDSLHKISDITDRILNDQVIDDIDDCPFHCAMYLSDDFKIADQRLCKDVKFRNIDEFAHPVALSKFNRDYPESFYYSDWIVTSGRKEGKLITRPSEQLLGDAIYGASLCLIAKSDIHPFNAHISGEYETFTEIAYEFHVVGDFSGGVFIEHHIPIYITPNGKIFIGRVTDNVESFYSRERYLEELSDEREQSEDKDYDLDYYDELGR